MVNQDDNRSHATVGALLAASELTIALGEKQLAALRQQLESGQTGVDRIVPPSYFTTSAKPQTFAFFSPGEKGDGDAESESNRTPSHN